MEQARKRLVELLLEADYVTSRDSKHLWWEKDVTVGAVNNNYQYYKYFYSINENRYGKNGIFYIDEYSIMSVLEKENSMTQQQIEDLIESTLEERYNFGNIATITYKVRSTKTLGEHYNY